MKKGAIAKIRVTKLGDLDMDTLVTVGTDIGN